MKFCENCGSVLKDNLSDCKICGNTVMTNTMDETAFTATTDSLDMKQFSRIKEEIKAFQENNYQEIQNNNINIFPRLVIIKGGTKGREFPVNKDVSNIGRWDPHLQSFPEIDLSDEDIDAKVSRFHARILRRSEGYYIEDVGSKNGTFLNKEFRLVKGIEYSLKDEDEIIIGHTFFSFKIK